MISPGLLSLGSGGTFSMAASQVDYYTEDQAAVDEQSSPQLQVRLGRCELATVAQHKMTMSTCTYSLP